jgi:hypothetical protein
MSEGDANKRKEDGEDEDEDEASVEKECLIDCGTCDNPNVAKLLEFSTSSHFGRGEER